MITTYGVDREVDVTTDCVIIGDVGTFYGDIVVDSAVFEKFDMSACL